MISKGSLAAKLYTKWESIRTGKQKPAKCFIGFDGFTDEISQAVEQRENAAKFTPFSEIKDFGKRIVKAAGKSCNIELVPQKTKLGGNAPIMTNALLSGDHLITFCGPIGVPGQIEPIFQQMARECVEVIPLGSSAHSDAIEFQDGKVIFGKMGSLSHINYDSIVKTIGKDNLLLLLNESDLFVCANWTMLPMMNEFWKRILTDICPQLDKPKKRELFVDLADPAKRSDEDLKEGLLLLKKLSAYFRVNLGLNEAEAVRIHQVLGGDKEEPEQLIQLISKKSGLQSIIVHTTYNALSMVDDTLHTVEGPFTPTPKLTTGAGDNFNAGFCTALLYGLSPEECLLSGVATSGFYVRHAKSPTIAELAAFLHKWEELGENLK